MKTFFYAFFVYITFIGSLHVYGLEPRSSDQLRSEITPAGSNSVITSSESGQGLLDAILEFAKDSIFRLLGLIAIGVFLYIGGKLLMARGNAEELKKAMTSFIYAAIGLFVVAAAWALVRFIAGINIL